MTEASRGDPLVRIVEASLQALDLEVRIMSELDLVYDTGVGREICLTPGFCVSERITLGKLLGLARAYLNQREAVLDALKRLGPAIKAFLDKLDLALELVRRAGYDPADALERIFDGRITYSLWEGKL